VDGLQAVQARIAEIQSQFARVAPAPVRRATPASAPTSAPSFATALAAASNSGELTPAKRLSPGQYGKLTPPAELAKYGNGKIPADALKSIGVGDNRLYAPAADAFVRMNADAKAAGITIGVNDSYRSYEEQVQLAKEKGLYSQGGLAANPGSSNHGWGLALDLDLNSAAQKWMRDNGYKYGFAEDTAREPWHWGYRPAA
jgi:hypothetical protein